LETDTLPPESRVRPAHVFTVDVEEYFHVSAFEHVIARHSWDGLSSRLELGLDRLLELLAGAGARGTFFTLGWVASRHPDLVRRILAGGHEIASHGYWHRRVVTQSPREFREDVKRSKLVLEEVTGRPVDGYRAPSFSIVKKSEWALEILAEEGFRYDSSRYPIRRSGYGSPHVVPTPHLVATPSGTMLELPMSILRVGPLRIPAAGGGWFRQFPLQLTTRALMQYEHRGAHGMFYIHPWELDPGQPRQSVGRLTQVRHYRGLETTSRRLELLLSEFRFDSVRSLYDSTLSAIESAPAQVG
jgi:polysaccharide deacetylase family protein (PEP-CTERM system associated)